MTVTFPKGFPRNKPFVMGEQSFTDFNVFSPTEERLAALLYNLPATIEVELSSKRGFLINRKDPRVKILLSSGEIIVEEGVFTGDFEGEIEDLHLNVFLSLDLRTGEGKLFER